MFLDQPNNQRQGPQESALVGQIFEDFEAKSNLVGLFDLALKVAKRNPALWAKINSDNN